MSTDERAQLAEQLWELSCAASMRASLASVGLARGRADLPYNRRISLAKTIGEGRAQARAYRAAAKLVQRVPAPSR